MIRILLFIVLGAIGYYTVKGKFKSFEEPEPRKDIPPPQPKDEKFKDSSDMVADPICGMYVDPASAVYLIHGDKKLFFCSEDCRRKFLKGPN